MMDKATVEKLALLYVEKNLAIGDSPLRALELFEEAQNAIKKELGDRLSKHVSSSAWSL
ncbi:hypothetical protein INF37_09620 [Pseudoflavonifractor sp. DSM 107456]|uniref:Uncharacterized protein n=1 Tax=Pseudoflavonifractor gallinarum TaxID=2779352 RepID=A0ABR9RC49_9FIRM|nr:hypothetical protein [Pseudoflavonifractor gallinarum]MBE5056255.1 hypothetical protein [Pseudoflavonifractor gallinarum]